MKRFKETKTKKVPGRGLVYRIALSDTLRDDVQILTSYMPQEKERLDLIAHKFYNDSSKWFIIAKANKEITGNFYATPGKALVIPRID